MTMKDRKTGEIREKKESSMMKLLYGTKLGRANLKVLSKPVFSKAIAVFMATGISSLIAYKVIKKNKIDLNEYTKKKYRSYNDFFTRKIKVGSRKIDYDKNILISPADSKLKAYKINEDSLFYIKDSYYSVKDLLNGNKIYKEYNNGYALIFRLEVTDYHRYCYIDNGTQEKNIKIKGILHSVRPIVLGRYNIYKRNSREYTLLHTENFGDVIQVEVGAIMVGKIVNHFENHEFKKGEEKGLFEFGGSTIVLLVKQNMIDVDKDILTNTESDIETIVKYGEKIGIKKN